MDSDIIPPEVAAAIAGAYTTIKDHLDSDTRVRHYDDCDKATAHRIGRAEGQLTMLAESLFATMNGASARGSENAKRSIAYMLGTLGPNVKLAPEPAPHPVDLLRRSGASEEEIRQATATHMDAALGEGRN